MSARRSAVEAAALLEANAGLARAATRGFRRPGVEPDDLRQIALTAMYEAALFWDEGNGTPFGGYAWKAMRRALSHFIRREQSALHLGHRAHTQLPRIQAASSELHRLMEREPTVDELADYLDEDPFELETTLSAIRRGAEVPLDKPASRENNEPNSSYIASPTGRATGSADLGEAILAAMDRAELTNRQRECLTLLYLSGAQRSQSDVASEMGISRQRVMSLRDAAISKIRRTSELGNLVPSTLCRSRFSAVSAGLPPVGGSVHGEEGESGNRQLVALGENGEPK
jgi:RNA polymerase sigma factor (sigma-70 family)